MLVYVNDQLVVNRPNCKLTANDLRRLSLAVPTPGTTDGVTMTQWVTQWAKLARRFPHEGFDASKLYNGCMVEVSY